MGQQQRDDLGHVEATTTSHADDDLDLHPGEALNAGHDAFYGQLWLGFSEHVHVNASRAQFGDHPCELWTGRQTLISTDQRCAAEPGDRVSDGVPLTWSEEHGTWQAQ